MTYCTVAQAATHPTSSYSQWVCLTRPWRKADSNRWSPSTAATAIIGMVFFCERPNAGRLCCLVLILIGRGVSFRYEDLPPQRVGGLDQ
jgi:hypothetical protein